MNRLIIETQHGLIVGALLDRGDGVELPIVVKSITKTYANERRTVAVIEMYAQVEERERPAPPKVAEPLPSEPDPLLFAEDDPRRIAAEADL